MILHTKLQTDDKGNIKSPQSNYNPDKKVKDLTQAVLKDFNLGYEIMHKPYREFNDMSVIERQAKDQKTFNSFIDPKSTDPDEAWKSNAFRPITRNKVISIAAHITGSLIFPHVEAQNDQQEEDKDAAQVMKDLMEWSAEQSNYERTFLYAVIAALVNPAVIIHTQFAETYRTIKEIQESGKWTEKKVLDEILSGFIDSLVPIDELFIADIYESDIQKQPFLIRRRAIDFSTAESLYCDNPNFKEYVRPGLQILYAEATDSFYEQYDETLQNRLVEEITYYNRSKDLQLVFLNGVLVTDPDQPNPRKDKKYPFAKTGYETFDEGKFFYYKSLVNKLKPDQDVINTLYQMVIDGTFLQLMPPTVVYGNEFVSSSVVTPGTITHFKDPNSKLEKVDVQNNLTAGFNALNKMEDSVSESSSDVLSQGQSNKGNQTAFEVSRLEQNARIMLGLFGKMIGFLVKDFGELRMSDIIQFLTVGDVEELSSEATNLKFKSFILPGKSVDGKTKTRKIDFDLDLPDEPTPQEEYDKMEFDLLDKEGGMDGKMRIYKVNPTLFRRLKYKVKVTPDLVTPTSENVKKAMNLEAYDRAIANPLIDQEAVTRELLLGSYEATKDDPDKFISKAPVAQQNGSGQAQDSGLASILASPQKQGSTPELLAKTL